MILGAQRRNLVQSPKGFGGWVARVMQVFLVPLGVGLGVIGSVHSLK